MRFLDEIGESSHVVGWHFDIGNVGRNGWAEQWIKILGKRINRIHVKEYDTKKMKEEGLFEGFDVDLTQGTNNWPAVMKPSMKPTTPAGPSPSSAVASTRTASKCLPTAWTRFLPCE